MTTVWKNLKTNLFLKPQNKQPLSANISQTSIHKSRESIIVQQRIPCGCKISINEEDICNFMEDILAYIQKQIHSKRNVKIKCKFLHQTFSIQLSKKILQLDETLAQQFCDQQEQKQQIQCDCCKEISSENSQSENSNSRDIIQKDLLRTFNNSYYYKDEEIKFLMTELLLKMQEKNSRFKYTQGMNYIVTAIVYHCRKYSKCLKVLKFIFDKLEMEKIFCFQQLKKFQDTFQILLSQQCKEFNNWNNQEESIDLAAIVFDWFLTLGFKKIPIEHSPSLLNKLLRDGWVFFFKFLIQFFKIFFERDHKMEQSIFEIQAELKNFHKDRSIIWLDIIIQCQTIQIDKEILRRNLDLNDI